MKLPAAAVAVSSVLLVLAATSGAVTFDATNTVPSTDGGARFDREVGVDNAKQVLSDASSFIWATFNQPNPEDYRPVDSVSPSPSSTASSSAARASPRPLPAAPSGSAASTSPGTMATSGRR
jgi:hypothetical protein